MNRVVGPVPENKVNYEQVDQERGPPASSHLLPSPSRPPSADHVQTRLFPGASSSSPRSRFNDSSSSFLFVHDGDDAFSEIRVSDLLGQKPVTYEEMVEEYKLHKFPMSKDQLEQHWAGLKLADIRRSPLLENAAVTFAQLKDRLKERSIHMDKAHLEGVWTSMLPAERRISPHLDNRPVVWEQFAGEYYRHEYWAEEAYGKEAVEIWLKNEWEGLTVWVPKPGEIQEIEITRKADAAVGVGYVRFEVLDLWSGQ